MGRTRAVVADVRSAFGRAWSLRLPLMAAQAAVSLASFAIVSPLTALLMHGAIGLSGQAALSDMDIAGFLLTPVGFVCLVVLLGILLTGAVFGLAVMMSIELAERHGGVRGPIRAMGWFARRAPAVLYFSVRLVVLILLISAPFVLVAVLTAQAWLTEHDINFYLAQRPPEFTRAALVIGAVLATLAVVLLNRLSAWAVALPGLLFAGFHPRGALGESARLMRGRRIGLILRVALWAVAGAALGLAGVGVFRGVGAALLPMADGDLGQGIAMLALVLVGWFVVNLAISAIVTGALATLLVRTLEATGARVVPPQRLVGLPGRGRPVLALAAVLAAGLVAAVALSAAVRPSDTVEIIGHRGAAGARPENTLASIRKAAEDGADWIEIDVQETADGEVVVLHDQDFMKLAGVDLKIRNATMADIDGIDIGSWFGPEYADQRAPTLRRVLDEPLGPARVLIELKYYGHDVDLEARTARIVEETGAVDRVAFMSLKYSAVRRMKALRPEWRVGLLAATAIGDLSSLEADFFAVKSSLVSPRLLRRAHARGREVYAWTVNDPLEMSRLISLGVDGLITDEPALARQVIETRASLSTPERLLLAVADRLGFDIAAGARKYRDASP